MVSRAENVPYPEFQNAEGKGRERERERERISVLVNRETVRNRAALIVKPPMVKPPTVDARGQFHRGIHEFRFESCQCVN